MLKQIIATHDTFGRTTCKLPYIILYSDIFSDAQTISLSFVVNLREPQSKTSQTTRDSLTILCQMMVNVIFQKISLHFFFRNVYQKIY